MCLSHSHSLPSPSVSTLFSRRPFAQWLSITLVHVFNADGMFFGDLFMLLAVMMVYKYWDSITQEDLEFAVGGKQHSWEIHDPLLNNRRMQEMANYQ
jgi:Chitin synthase export chaperone